jgi:hypothetical protein
MDLTEIEPAWLNQDSDYSAGWTSGESGFISRVCTAVSKPALPATVYSPQGKGPGREAYHSPQSCAEVTAWVPGTSSRCNALLSTGTTLSLPLHYIDIL